MDKIFSGENSEQLWHEINALTATSTIDDVRDVIYSLVCDIQKLEGRVDGLSLMLARANIFPDD